MRCRNTPASFLAILLISCILPFNAFGAGFLDLSLDLRGTGYQASTSYFSTTVTAHDADVAGVSLVLRLPLNATTTTVSVDGQNITPNNPLPVNDIALGHSRIVTFGVEFSDWGLNAISVEAVSSDVAVASVSVSGTKVIHKPGTLSQPLAVVDLGDSNGDVVVSAVESAGWDVVRLTPEQLAAGSLDVSSYPVPPCRITRGRPDPRNRETISLWHKERPQGVWYVKTG